MENEVKVRIVGALTLGPDGYIHGKLIDLESDPDGKLTNFVVKPDNPKFRKLVTEELDQSLVMMDRRFFIETGRLGGRAKNKAKREAARRNGKLGGRPRKK
jgi:hypothetical protein